MYHTPISKRIPREILHEKCPLAVITLAHTTMLLCLSFQSRSLFFITLGRVGRTKLSFDNDFYSPSPISRVGQFACIVTALKATLNVDIDMKQKMYLDPITFTQHFYKNFFPHYRTSILSLFFVIYMLSSSKNSNEKSGMEIIDRNWW